MVKWLFLKEMSSITNFSENFKSHCAQLCLDKLTNLDAKGFQEFFQKYFVVHERSAVKNLFSSYVWSEVDSSFY